MIRNPCAHPAVHRYTHLAALHGIVLGRGSCLVCYSNLAVGPSLHPQFQLSSNTITTHGACAQQEGGVVGRRSGTRADLMATEGTSFATALASEGTCSATAHRGRNRRRHSRRRKRARMGHGRRAKTNAEGTETTWEDQARDHCLWRRLGVGSCQELALTSARTKGRSHTSESAHGDDLASRVQLGPDHPPIRERHMPTLCRWEEKTAMNSPRESEARF
mmetsp:Transcript_4947/g.31707  ORF Transcript_4947/g.31707 Transcript_4947/m.31707 type:complete len:219 (+) Transcript_4947:1535-2191(+)